MATPSSKDKPAKNDPGEQTDLTFLRPLLDRRPADSPGGMENDNPLGKVREALQHLHTHDGQSPPQSLLMEGGDANSRLAAALYWAGLLNCALGQPAASLPGFIQDSAEARPCWSCPACTRLLNGSFRDFFLLDGRGQSIKIDQVREIRKLIGDPPREAGKRVIVMAESQNLTIEAANALLKALEEPCPGTVFVLTAPQRERLLPTLVSRSWVLTLPWLHSGENTLNNPDTLAWGESFTNFLRSGREWFSRTGSKGSMDVASLQGLISYCRAALAAALLMQKTATNVVDNNNILNIHPAAGLPLSSLLAAGLDKARLRRFSEALDSCEEALAYTVNPALLADWLATHLFIWLEEIRRAAR